MKSEEPPVIPPSDSDENLLQDDNVDEQEDESDEEEVSLGDFDEQGKMTVDSGKSHDLILFLKSVHGIENLISCFSSPTFHCIFLLKSLM